MGEHDHRSDEAIAWGREFWRAMGRHSTGGVYLNFPGLGEDNEALVRAGYGSNYDRLASLKAKYDPTNLFRVNQNVVPSAATRGPEMPTSRAAMRVASGGTTRTTPRLIRVTPSSTARTRSRAAAAPASSESSSDHSADATRRVPRRGFMPTR